MNKLDTLKKPKTIFSILIIAACFIYIFNVFDLNKVALTISKTNLAIFIIGSIITIKVFWLVRALRWLTLLKAVGYRNIPLKNIYFATSTSLALSVVTPVQSGELLKVEILKKYFPKLSRTDGYLSLIFERILDLLFVVLIATISLAVSPFKMPTGILQFIGFSFCAATFLLLIFRKKIAGYSSTFREIKAKFSLALKRPIVLFMLCIYTLIAWTSIIFGWWLALLSLGIVVGKLEIISLTTGMTLINVMSLIPGAIGVSEVGIAIWLEFLGVGTNQSAAGSVIIRLYGLMSVVLGLVSLALYSIQRKLNKSSLS